MIVARGHGRALPRTTPEYRLVVEMRPWRTNQVVHRPAGHPLQINVVLRIHIPQRSNALLGFHGDVDVADRSRQAVDDYRRVLSTCPALLRH